MLFPLEFWHTSVIIVIPFHIFQMDSNSWKALEEHHRNIEGTHLKTLLADKERNSKFVAKFEDILLDYTH